MTYGNGVYQHLHTGCFPPTWRCLSPSETQEFSKVANSLGFVLYEPAFYTLYGGYRLPHSYLDLFLCTTRKKCCQVPRNRYVLITLQED